MNPRFFSPCIAVARYFYISPISIFLHLGAREFVVNFSITVGHYRDFYNWLPMSEQTTAELITVVLDTTMLNTAELFPEVLITAVLNDLGQISFT